MPSKFARFKQFLINLMSDGKNAQELSSYSFVMSAVGLHTLLIYYEHIGVHTTLVDYATAMGIIAGGHGVAYLARATYGSNA